MCPLSRPALEDRALAGRACALQIPRFDGPEVLDVVELPDPVPGEGQQLHEASTAGVDFADTHHRLSCN